MKKNKKESKSEKKKSIQKNFNYLIKLGISPQKISARSKFLEK